MSFSIVTFRVDSRYVNGAIFVLFDVIIFNIFVAMLCKSQKMFTQQRLRKGHRVRLRESAFRAYNGGLLSDGTILTRVVMFTHVALLGLLFALTLGVNGSKEQVLVPTNRRYVTRIAADIDTDFNHPKSHPEMFSSCMTRSNVSILFYPSAFDTEGNKTITDLWTMKDADGNIVSIDAPNMLCQNFGKLSPMLIVRRCGAVPANCANLDVKSQEKLELLPAANINRRTKESRYVRIGHGGFDADGRIVTFYRNVHIRADFEYANEYNRLLCKERPKQGEEGLQGKFHFNCIIGKWNDEDSVFTFKLRQVFFERTSQKMDAVLDAGVSTDVEFFLTSTEMQVEWDATQKGESFFSDGLSQVGQDLITGQTFLEKSISRAVVAQEVGSGMEILVQEERLITEVTRIALASYGVMGLVAVLSLLFMWLSSLQSKKYNMIDATSYPGVTKLLRREIGRKDKARSDWTEFGITLRRENGLKFYQLRAVRDDEEVVPLPQGEALV